MPESPPIAYIALGSNLGDPLSQLRAAAQDLGRLGQIRRCSSLYRTTPVGGPPNQPDYLNAVIALEPDEAHGSPHDLLMVLHALERAQGRERRVRWEARTLDLDLLAWGGHVIDTPELTLPHPRMMERAFVLAPLCEIAPNWRHPVSGQNPCEVLKRLPESGIERTDLELEPASQPPTPDP